MGSATSLYLSCTLITFLNTSEQVLKLYESGKTPIPLRKKIKNHQTLVKIIKNCENVFDDFKQFLVIYDFF